MIRSVILGAAAMLAAAPALAEAPSPQRYSLDLTVVQDGVEIVHTSTQIFEDAPASASATVNGVTYNFEANLFLVQGDGSDAQMMLEAHLSRGEEEIAAPRLTLMRGDSARIEVGDEASNLRMAIAAID